MNFITYSLLFLSVFMVFSCGNMKSKEQNEKYKAMHFVRDGGGQIDFELFETENENQLKAVVSKYDFRDTTIELMISKNSDNTTAFSSFHSALNKETPLNGNFKQSTMATGTWVSIYFSSNEQELEVTNETVRNSLLKFEELILSQID